MPLLIVIGGCLLINSDAFRIGGNGAGAAGRGAIVPGPGAREALGRGVPKRVPWAGAECSERDIRATAKRRRMDFALTML